MIKRLLILFTCFTLLYALPLPKPKALKKGKSGAGNKEELGGRVQQILVFNYPGTLQIPGPLNAQSPTNNKTLSIAQLASPATAGADLKAAWPLGTAVATPGVVPNPGTQTPSK